MSSANVQTKTRKNVSGFMSKKISPQVGFEPTTNSLHITPKLLLGVDYIFAMVNEINFRHFGI